MMDMGDKRRELSRMLEGWCFCSEVHMKEGLRLGRLLWDTLGWNPRRSLIRWLEQLDSGLWLLLPFSLWFLADRKVLDGHWHSKCLHRPALSLFVCLLQTTGSEACSKDWEAGVWILSRWSGVLEQNTCFLWASVFPKYVQISHMHKYIFFMRCRLDWRYASTLWILKEQHAKYHYYHHYHYHPVLWPILGHLYFMFTVPRLHIFIWFSFSLIASGWCRPGTNISRSKWKVEMIM